MARRLLAILVLLVPLLAHAEEARTPLQLDVIGEVAIDVDGKVYQHAITTIVTPEIKAMLDRAIPAWRFEPVVRNGRAVPAKSSVYLTLSATPVDRGYALKIQRVRFGGDRSMVPGSLHPVYPRAATRARASADLLVAVHIDADGKVLDAVALRSRVLGVRRAKADLDALHRAFEEATVRTMRSARFKPADPATGAGEDTVIVPMLFCVEGACPALSGVGWRETQAAEPSRRIPWLPADRQQFDAEGLGNGQSIALGAGIRLKEDVAGASL